MMGLLTSLTQWLFQQVLGYLRYYFLRTYNLSMLLKSVSCESKSVKVIKE